MEYNVLSHKMQKFNIVLSKVFKNELIENTN